MTTHVRQQCPGCGKWLDLHGSPVVPTSCPDCGQDVLGLRPEPCLRDRVPPGVLATLDRYVGRRVRPGGFVCAVLANDLYDACRRADETNLACLYWIAQYADFALPIQCRGSREAVEAWLAGEKGGR